MPAPEPEDHIERRFASPTQCVLWQKPELVASLMADRFEILETFLESSHQDRRLLKCRECGQLYIFEWYETIDWEGGDDPQYMTYIPVQTPAQAQAVRDAPMFDLSRISPRLVCVRQTAVKVPTARWIGK